MTNSTAAPEPQVLFVAPITATKNEIIKSICLIDSKTGVDFNERVFAPIGLDRMTKTQLVDVYKIKRKHAPKLGVLCFDDAAQIRSSPSDFWRW